MSDSLIELLDARGVENVRQGDMFDLESQFTPDRFGSVLVAGTQLGLAKSICGLREFLGALARVTRDDATAVVDAYDPTYERAKEMLGYRKDALERGATELTETDLALGLWSRQGQSPRISWPAAIRLSATM